MPCYKIALTKWNELLIEYSDDGVARYIYSSETGAPVMTECLPGDFDSIVVTINHYQLIAALKAMARDAPGDYSGG
jgi:hypothetical protein